MVKYAVFVWAAAIAFAQNGVRPNATERQQLSQAASRMLNHAAQARTEMARKDNHAALNDIREALNEIRAMEAAKPRAAQPLMVTMYTELMQISVSQPATAARRSGATAGSANRSATAPAGREQVVRDAEGEATRVTLNATQANGHLEAAKNALQNGDASQADRDLAAVKQDVKAETVAEDLPLLKARQNFALALGHVRQGHYETAAAALRQASSALGEYAESKSRHAADAGRLKAEVDSLAGSLAQNQADAENKIAKWWNEVSGWFTPLQPPPK
jgi:hypothetical protein